MVGHDIPLNQGCLKPVSVFIPPGSILDPSEDAAVVGGNVLTSQRLVDVIFKAFKVCAASQVSVLVCSYLCYSSWCTPNLLKLPALFSFCQCKCISI